QDDPLRWTPPARRGDHSSLSGGLSQGVGTRARCGASALTTVVDHLSRLIRIPSVSAMPNRPVTNYAASVLSNNGWTINEIAYGDDSGVEKVNLVAAPPGQSAAAREV